MYMGMKLGLSHYRKIHHHIMATGRLKTEVNRINELRERYMW